MSFRFFRGAAALFSVASAFLVPTTVWAASWQAASYGGNMPVDMYIPDTPMDPTPVVVSLHYCGGTKGNAQGWFKSYADSLGFIIITPQAGGNCFDANAARGGERGEIVAMVEWLIAEHNADPDRVFAAGASSGACMAQTLAATYPEVFAGGSSLAGVAAGAWTGGNEYGWSAPQLSDQEWGDKARDASEGFSGLWPRMQIWHGEGDTNLTYSQNWPAEVGQWTNLHGVSDGTSGTSGNWNRTSYVDASGVLVVETNSAPGVQHDLTGSNLWGDVVRFFRLEEAPGMEQAEGGAGGMPGSAGMSGTAEGGAPGGTAGSGTAGGAPQGMGGSPVAMPGAGGTPVAMAGSPGVAGEGTAGPAPVVTSPPAPVSTPITPVTMPAVPPPVTPPPVGAGGSMAPAATDNPGTTPIAAPGSATGAATAPMGSGGGATTSVVAADDSTSGDDGGCSVHGSVSRSSSTYALLSVGLIGLVARRRRRTTASANPRGPSWAAAARFLAAAVTLCATLFTSGTASAASLQNNVSGWQQGTEPNWMSMSIYVPDNLAENPPILVMLHYCGGNAGNVFSLAQQGGIVSAADQNGYILLVPQTSRNCWDVATNDSLTHDGGSDTLSIVHQVEYTVSEYGANADRVYVIGTSGGAMGAEGLAAVYPEVFKGAVEFSGVPAGCWAVGNMTDGQWSSACAGGQVTHTEQEWGDMVRAMYPDYDGFRPRIQLWHGDADSTINFANHTEAIKQWRNVLNLPEDPTSTSSVTVNGKTFNRQEWKDACDNTVLDVMTEPGGPHNTSANMTGQYSLDFLALGVAGDTDPVAGSSCGMSGGDPADGGTSGGGAPSGGTSSGGAPNGGAPVGMGGMGPVPENGGSPSTGGTPAPVGMPTPVGMPATGGAGNPVPGDTATPVPSGTAPVVTPGVVPMPGVATMTPNATPPATASGTGLPAAANPPGAAGTGTAAAGAPSTAGTDMMPTVSDAEAEPAGCGCKIRNSSSPANLLALAGIFVAIFARRRFKRSAQIS